MKQKLDLEGIENKQDWKCIFKEQNKARLETETFPRLFDEWN